MRPIGSGGPPGAGDSRGAWKSYSASNTDTRQQEYMSRLSLISNQISSLMLQLNGISGNVSGIDDNLNKLPTRIQQIRKMNYRVMTNLEKDVTSLSERWSTIKPGIANIIGGDLPALISEGNAIESELNQRRFTSNYDTSQLSGFQMRISALQARASGVLSRISGATGDTSNKLHSLDRDVGLAESTLNLTSSSSFKWKQDESPIISVNAKDLNADVEGVLTLTNQRFIYESQKEIVLKKTFFIATQKKKVRETSVDKPIGMIDNIVKGRVGILSGQGLYIKFKPDSGLQEMKLDTSGEDADLVLRFHNFIANGEADQELATTESSKTDEHKSAPIVCPRCSAPYSEEIYRGQTTLQCKYCGANIPVSK
jgi:archaellum component FlaC